MEKKIGVYICTGCDIGESLKVDALVRKAQSKGGKVVKTHAALCSEEGNALIAADIANEGVNTVVIAACSPRAMVDAFRIDVPILERVNLREHVVWSHEPNNDDTQTLAEDYLVMGLVRVQKSEPLEPFIQEISKKILVVGGGLTGTAAALEAAEAGYEVVVLEKQGRLGGWLAQAHKDVPQKAPYRELEAPQAAEKARAAQANPKIRVLTGATLEKIAGQPGLFDATVNVGGASETIRVGAIVLAAGSRPYEAAKLGHLGYGTTPNVVTSTELEAMAVKGSIVRPSDNKKAQSVLFIQCAGSRDANHLPYCSATCCANSLKQALYVREQNPEAEVTIVYRDMRTPGQGEFFYQRAQEDPGIFLTKGDVTGVAAEGGKVAVTAADTLLGPQVKFQADLVVLATGMVPATADEPILNLQYRQGPALPTLKYGFPDSHFICFPYETQRTGIYAAGTVRQPMDTASALQDAAGAALKAIHCVELTSQGKAVHPRVGDESFPEFFLQRCTQCKRCTEECPFGTLDEDEKGTPKPNPYRCRRCGVCMGACPERIISFKNYSVDMIASMMKAVDISDDEDVPTFLGLICENDAYPALDMAGLARLKYSPHIRFIPLRCLGGTNLVWMAEAMNKGVEGVLLVGCKHGENYQCHFVKGSELCSIRLSKVQETLNRLQLESGRIKMVQLSINEYDQLPGIVEEFVEEVKGFGPNPFRGL
jgi:quinone-modifying oxidoreductase subunit QmoB